MDNEKLAPPLSAPAMVVERVNWLLFWTNDTVPVLASVTFPLMDVLLAKLDVSTRVEPLSRNSPLPKVAFIVEVPPPCVDKNLSVPPDPTVNAPPPNVKLYVVAAVAVGALTVRPLPMK
jgi:hypothetical protein